MPTEGSDRVRRRCLRSVATSQAAASSANIARPSQIAHSGTVAPKVRATAPARMGRLNQ